MTIELALQKLEARFPGRLERNASVCAQHGTDESWRPAAPPDAVIFVESANEVSDVLSVCGRFGVAVIPFGAGTSVEGHVLAVKGGICIDLSRMNTILQLNAEDMDVRIQPGVTRQQLNHYLRDTGLFFPVDPGADCTIGGMVATRASGTNAVRYGTIRENVLSLQVVLASGEIIETGTRAKKSAAGYDLTHLFTGSEGTLGVVTEISLRLYGIPEKISSGICNFPTVEAAVNAVAAVIQLGVPIARIELLDETAVLATNAYSNLDHAVRPTLFLEFHGSERSVKDQVANFRDIVQEYGASELAFASEQEERNKLWMARHQLYYATKALSPGRAALTTDICVPISRLAECMVDTQKELAAAPLQTTMLGHVGDGNFHCVILFDPQDQKECDEAERLNHRMVKRAIEMDGTCTGEHGIGLGKQKFLELERGASLVAMRAIKRALDPKNIMNPGKIFSVDCNAAIT